MVNRKRRKVLRLLSLSPAGITSISGCLGTRNAEARISELMLINLDDTEREVEVTVLRNGENVYRNTFSLKPSAGSGAEPYPAPVIREEWMNDAGRYTVKCQLKAKDRVERRQFPSEDRNGDCFSVEIRVSEGGILSVPYTRPDSCKQSTESDQP